MKKVLITNFFFERYTGSELHVLEMAKMFESKGYEVTIAVFRKAYPLLEKAGMFHIMDVLNEELEAYDFDIVFVQHYPVFDYLCCKYNISYRKLIVSKLSVINELEYLPICTNDADLILCVSDECAKQVREDIGDDIRIKVLKNSVGEEFFAVADVRTERVQLNKIAVVSNHVPDELSELAKEMGEEYQIDYIGVQYSPRLVDSELLKKYDLIITIGRTVQQCFASKVPVYVYDYFGGPGYINDTNFALAEKNNFSGRGFERKTISELKDDIIQNYVVNNANLDKLHSIAKERYSFNTNFEQIYQKLMQKETKETRHMNFYDGIEKQRMLMYSKAAKEYAVSKEIQSQLYINYGNGFTEQDSFKWNVTEAYTITKKIEIDRRVECLRFDPCDIPAECYIYDICINGKAKREYSGITEKFWNFDPQFVIQLSEEEKNLNKISIEIIYKFNKLLFEDVESLEKELAIADDKIKVLHNTIEEMREYYKFTPKNMLHRLVDFIKRKFRFI